MKVIFGLWRLRLSIAKWLTLSIYSGDVNEEDSDDEPEELSRTVSQKADRSHLIVWQVFSDS